MKYHSYFTFFFILLLPFSSKGQEAVVEIFHEKIYLGGDNIARIAIPNTPPQKIKATVDNGEIIRDTTGYYRIIPTQKGSITLTIEANKKVTTKKYYVHLIPYQPVLPLDYTPNGFIKLDIFKHLTGIMAKAAHNIICVNISILGYDMLFIRKNLPNIILHIDSFKFSEEALDIINTLSKGDVVHFYNITGSHSEGTILRPNYMTFIME